MNGYKSTSTYLKELGERVKLYRVFKGITQQELEEKTGVSVRSISRLEQGMSVQMETFIKILNCLGLGENLAVLIPDQKKRPSYYLNESKTRQRARRQGKENVVFKWGDEQ